MIEELLNKLPEGKGTKEELIILIKQEYNIDLNEKPKEFKTFEQILSKYFMKEKGYY